MACGEFQA